MPASAPAATSSLHSLDLETRFGSYVARDALWAAEQILRSGCCGALLLWQQHVRSEALRRLHLAAQSGETLFCLMRPLAAALAVMGGDFELSGVARTRRRRVRS